MHEQWIWMHLHDMSHSLILVDWRCKKMVGREAEGTKGDYFELKQIQLWIIVS